MLLLMLLIVHDHVNVNFDVGVEDDAHVDVISTCIVSVIVNVNADAYC